MRTLWCSVRSVNNGDWCIVSTYKLTAAERTLLTHALDNLTFTCGAELCDLELGSERLDRDHVFVRGVCCMTLQRSYTILLEVTRLFAFTVLRVRTLQQNKTATQSVHLVNTESLLRK